MKLTRKLVIVGALLGIIPIVLGIVALTTKSWIKLNLGTLNIDSYGLFPCNDNSTSCATISGFKTVQGLLIAGVSAIGVGVIIAVLLEFVFKNRWIQLIRQIFLFAGPSLILIGLFLYAKYVFEDVSTKPSTASQKVTLVPAYSIILMIVTCILGFLTATYFAFVAGLGIHRNHVIQTNAPVVITQYSERF